MALVIFDLDGTLVQSYEGIAISMNRVLEKLSLPTHPTKKYMDFVGNGLKELVRKALPDDKKDLHDVAVPMMREQYKLDYMYKLYVFDGIYMLLDKLTQDGYKLAVASNKPIDMVVKIMNDFFSDYEFTHLLGVSEKYPRKPDTMMIDVCIEENNIDKEEVFFVGDTEVDYKTSKNAEITPIIITWGFRTRQKLEELKPKYLVDSPKEVYDIIVSAR